MSNGYQVADVKREDAVNSGKSETLHVDFVEELDCTAMRPKVWFLEPGNERKTYHHHGQQEELYYQIEGPGRMRLDGEVRDIPEGAFVRVAPEMPRQVFNDTDREHVWLVVGAPAVEDPGRAVEK